MSIEKKHSFEKFASFENKYVDTNMLAPYFKRHNGQLTLVSLTSLLTVDDKQVFTSFEANYPEIKQIVKNHETPDFPFRIFVRFVVGDNNQAHVLTFELWICSVLFVKYFELHGTFPFEFYITTLIYDMEYNNSDLRSLSEIDQVADPEPLPLKTANWNLYHPLLPYQQKSLWWMQNLEESIYRRSASIKFNTKTIPILQTGYCFHRQHGVITTSADPHSDPKSCPTDGDDDDNQVSVPFHGGILADVTGSGKTAVALGLAVFAEKSMTVQNQLDFPHNKLTSDTEKHIYFCSRSTLIVTPDSLIYQWKSEIEKFLCIQSSSSSLKIICISNMREYKKARLSDLLSANIVITTETFLKSKRYNQDIARYTTALTKNSVPTTPTTTNPTESTRRMKQNIAWRIAVNNFRKSGDDSIRSVPIESIKWRRIIIDEIHTFCDQTTSNINLLRGCFRWGLTGGPMIQNPNILQNYVKFLCTDSQYHNYSEFMKSFVNICFHRFNLLQLGTIECRLYIISQSTREKQLIMSSQGELSDEKQIQLCSYFNAIDTGNINVELINIDDLIRSTKKEKRHKLKELKLKIKYLELGIESIVTQISGSKKETQQSEENNKTGYETGLIPPENESELVPPEHTHINLIDVTNETFDDDIRDIIRGRQNRLARMLKRKNECVQEKQFIEKSVGFFETMMDTMKSDSIDNCPICLTERPSVITHCGHVFCRNCIVRCLKQHSQCPVCKAIVKPSDAHEIQISNNVNRQDSSQTIDVNASIYGSKFAQMLNLVKVIVSRGEQVVLVVQWPSLIAILRNMFQKHNIQVGIVKNNKSQLYNHNVLQKFKQGNLGVLIGMINTTGLDLTNANHLIFTHALFAEEYIVHTMEEQAIARIHRMGQTKPVYVYWFITRDTIEQKTYLQTRQHSLDLNLQPIPVICP